MRVAVEGYHGPDNLSSSEDAFIAFMAFQAQPVGTVMFTKYESEYFIFFKAESNGWVDYMDNGRPWGWKDSSMARSWWRELSNIAFS